MTLTEWFTTNPIGLVILSVVLSIAVAEYVKKEEINLKRIFNLKLVSILILFVILIGLVIIDFILNRTGLI